MEDAKLDKRAKEVYDTLCKVLDKRKLKYQKVGKDDDGDWTVRLSGVSNSLTIDFALFIDVKRQLIRMMARMPYSISEAKRIDGAIAVAHANYKMVNGRFDYDVDTGRIFFKISSCVRGSIIAAELIDYMINIMFSMVNQYNAQFLMISTGELTLQQFLAK